VIPMETVRKFWFQFEKLERPTALNLGCGVSAADYEDALNLLKERIFGPNGPPQIVRCIEDVQTTDLEKNHVLPNIGQMDIRGIWFPQGY
jgi:hypothetical protein